MTVHDAARAFDGVAEAYDRGRPDYPHEAVRGLLDALGLDDASVVIDLAAGTGKLTSQIVDHVGHVLAIEPAEGMRALLSRRLPDVEARLGTAEEIPVGDGAVDAVLVAQAFHWFDGESALAEIHRVLRPGGGLGLLWNLPDVDDDLNVALAAIRAPYRAGAPSASSLEWKRALEQTTRFGPLDEFVVRNVQHLDEQGVVDRILSVSFIAGLDDEDRSRVEAQVRGAFTTAAGGADEVEIPYLTHAYWLRRSD